MYLCVGKIYKTILSELVEYLYTHGVTHLFLDEVHKYPAWIRELKNIYDDYPRLHIVFTLMYALGSTADAGTARESFFSAMMSHNHTIQYAKQGDFQVDGRHIIEVGGKGKGFAQIANLPDSYVVADGIEIGFGNKIPLWLFGFTY